MGWSAAAACVEARKTEAFPDRPESPLYVLVNPEVLEASDELVEDWEGCFSVPGRYVDRDGQEATETFDGYLARVVQHELDHLDGKVFLDRMEATVSLSTIANWQRFGRGAL